MSEKMTVPEIKKKLTDLDVEFSDNMNKSELLELLNESNKDSEIVTYVVIRDFTDLQDKNKVYRSGDPFPHPTNKKVTKERIEELKTSQNKQDRPVIKERE